MTEETRQRVVIMGAGFIGVSLAAVFADAGWHVTIADPDPDRLEAVDRAIAAQTKAMALAGLKTDQHGAYLSMATPASALESADLVLECGPEDLAVKQDIFANLLLKVGSGTLLATTSSAIPISRIVRDPDLQAQCFVAHPVNPPSVLRLIEICPAPGTSQKTIERAQDIFSSAGFQCAILAREVEGFLLNRLQGAVLREAYRLVDDGITEPNEIDKVMRLGLGPRWALSGPFETAELNTPGGIVAHAARMGPAYKRMGEERGEVVEWSAELVNRVASARDTARGSTSISERADWRSRAVARIVAFRDRLLREAT